MAAPGWGAATAPALPLTFRIANGLAFGLTAFTLLKIFRGEYRNVNVVVYILTPRFLVRFFYMGKAG